MEKQTLVFTALPNGFTGDGSARLSVFIAPRLWSDSPGTGNLLLSQYPDLLQWPSRVSALAWEASLGGGPPVPLSPDGPSPLKTALWEALFHATTQVKPFRFEDYRGMPIETFPIAAIHDTIAGVYGRASSDPALGAGSERPGLGLLAADPDLAAIARPSFPEPEPEWNPQETAPVPFPDAPPTTEKPEPQPEPEPEPEPPMPSCCCGCGCLALPWRWLRNLFGGRDAKAPVSPEPPSSKPAPTPSFKTDVTPPPPPAPPGPGKSFLPPPLTPAQQQTRAAFDALDAFLKPFPGAEPDLPDAAKLAETWDFHQAVSSLGDFPEILRRLGLVVDLLLPAGTPLPAAGTVRVSATGVAWQPGTTIVSPRTHFVSSDTLFTAAPRPVQPEIANGFLRVDDASRFLVIQNDVAGDAVKLRNAATHFLRFALAVDRPGNLPGEGGLPALRTAGISLVRRDLAAELADQFRRSCALNRFLAAQDLSPEPPPVAGTGAPPAPSDELFAEDLVRGYRIDVFDTKTGVWRSLCERTGTYRFLDAPDPPETAADEGFVQLAATEPRDPSAPKSLRTGETLFTWNGWSLAAPRPGKAILPDDSHADPPNPAVTPFKVETSFKARPGSLPRLRFGRKYRLRARVADLAGNSVTNPGETAFDADVPQTTPEITAVRYEPLAPPVLMLQSAPVEGESVERLVIRTPAIGGLGTQTSRHVAPPKASQLMIELHGRFDGTTVDGSPAGYALASRESNSVRDGAQQTTPAVDGNPGQPPVTPSEKDPWIQPAPLVTVTWLPDPQAQGVALTGLPGEPVPGAARRIDFGAAWPDLTPFRLDVVPIPAAIPPAVPALAGNVLTVELPAAQRSTVRINSVIDPADLTVRGVWKWTEDQAPANLVAVEGSVLGGRHWAHLPWREITMVHAVQKPLAAPAVATLKPKKALGDTFADLTGDVGVDSPSTGRVQLLASWIDPVDYPDAPDAPPPGTQTRQAHVCEIEVPEGVSPVGVIDSSTGNPPRHELHDTKYHRVDYTPVGVTRFREYFPASTNTPAATTERGAAFPADVLNSARPDRPKLLYALPLFEWDTPPGTPGATQRTRSGGGLRLYLERPWFSSGDGELLGVVFQEGVDFLSLDETVKPFVTWWGADPLWDAGPAPVRAEQAHFPGSQKPKSGTLLAEHPAAVSVVGYPVTFDAARRLWFADLRIEMAGAYWPFVRLALARYQPDSVDGAHLSGVVRADSIQLPPRRQAKIAAGPAAVHLEVDGPVYVGSEVIQTIGARLRSFGGSLNSNGFSEIEAMIEQRDPTADPADELAWTPVESTRVTLFQNPAAPGHWEGDVPLAGPPASGPFRLALKELEWFRTDDAASADPPRSQIRVARRVVYADVFAL